MLAIDVLDWFVGTASKWAERAAISAVVAVTSCSVGPRNNGTPDSGSNVQLVQIDPAEGPLAGGVHARLTGLHFDDGTQNLSVSFGGTAAVVNSYDDSAADVTLPPGTSAGPVDVSVSNVNGTATLSGGFTYTCLPDASGQCIDLMTDSDHCGTPGNVCSSTTACLGGICSVPAPMPTARASWAATLGPDGRIYVIGGETPGAFGSSTVEAYDPRTNQWYVAASVSDLPFSGRAVTTRDGLIHAFGNDIGPHFVYDPSSDMWSRRRGLPRISYRPGVTVTNDGRIFLLSGVKIVPGGGQITNEAFAYDLTTNQWNDLPRMLHVHRPPMGTGTGANGIVYVFGKGDANYVDAFNPASGKWTTIGPSKNIVSAAAMPDGKSFYAVAVPTGFYFYDSAMNTWTAKADLSAAHSVPNRQGVSIVVGRDGRAYALGGSLDGGTFARVVEVYESKRDVWIAGPP